MAIGVKSGRIMFQRGTKAEWEASKLILLDGELAIESDTTKIKIGDGKSKYIDLPYISIGDIKVSELTEEDIAKITGPKGEKGDPGKDGVDGKDGTVNIAEMTKSQLMDIKKQLDIPVADDFVDKPSYNTDKANLDTKIKALEDGKVDKDTLDTINQGINNSLKKHDAELATKADKSELTNLATKDDLASVDVSDQLKDYAKKTEVEETYSKLSSDISSNLEGINAEINKKADKSHQHAISDIDTLDTKLEDIDTKISSNTSGIEGKANKSHTHSISDVSNLQSTLDNKALKTHTHSQYLTSSTADTKYLKKGEPIELTTQQKAELKGAPGKDGVDGKPGEPGKGIVDSRSGREIKLWVGTQSEYDSIWTKDGDTLYLIKE